MWWWLSCAAAPTVDTLPAPTHANGWDDLVAAVQRMDGPTARVLARDLTLGGVGEDGPWATRLGGALGALQVADDEDLGDTLAVAAGACRGCHEERGVPGDLAGP